MELSKGVKFFLAGCLMMPFLAACQFKQEKEDIIKVACNLPMTGDVAIYGESVKNGYEMALDDLKDSLFKYNIKIQFDYQDNKCQNKEAVSIMQKQLLDNCDIYVSGITQQTLSIKEQIEKKNIPHVIWSFYPLILSEKENIIRTWVNLPGEPSLFKQYMENKKDVKRIACVYLNAASANDLFNRIFIPMIKDKYEVVYNESYEIENTNFKDVVLKIKKENPDMIFVNGYQNHIIQLAKEFNTNQMKKDGNIVFTFDLLDAMGYVADEVLEGYIANIPSYVLDRSVEKKDWCHRYKMKYNRLPTYTDAYAYDCASAIYHAIRTKKQNEQLSLKDAILSLRFEGVTGDISFGKNGNMESKSIMCVVKDGTLIPIK